MKIIADTNLIVRFIVRDDIKQTDAVYKLFADCEELIIPTHVLCEFCWVLAWVYRIATDVVLEKIEMLAQSHKVNVREDEVEAGLAMMRKGGDFADGVNAYAGQKMGSGNMVFASFDRQAIRLLAEQGVPTLLVA